MREKKISATMALWEKFYELIRIDPNVPTEGIKII
jgi:hypothetical protein